MNYLKFDFKRQYSYTSKAKPRFYLLLIILIFHIEPSYTKSKIDLMGNIQAFILYQKSNKIRRNIVFVYINKKEFENWHSKFLITASQPFKRKWFKTFKFMSTNVIDFKREYAQILLNQSKIRSITALTFASDGMLLSSNNFSHNKYPSIKYLKEIGLINKNYKNFKKKIEKQKVTSLLKFSLQAYQSKLYLTAIAYAERILTLDKDQDNIKAANSLIKLTKGKMAKL